MYTIKNIQQTAKHLVLSILLLVMAVTTNAQSTTPADASVDALMKFEEYPIDYYTGMPGISVPLYTMPTYSKDISIDLSVNYHPGSVATFDLDTGNCGRGWNVTRGGAISRKVNSGPDEMEMAAGNPVTYRDNWYFNFMGYSGKFVIDKSGSVLTAKISENKGTLLKIELEYGTKTFEINSFTVYDDKGYRYVFQAMDNFVYVKQLTRKTTQIAYQLSAIYDNNGRALATFLYTNYTKHESYHQAGENNNFKEINTININGYGKIEFLNQTTAEGQRRFSRITVRDFLNNPVHRFDFSYTGRNLSQVDECDFGKTKVLSHKMYYKPPIFPAENIPGSDAWGYPNLHNKYCDYSKATTPEYVTGGVLQKMVLPTGGAVIYDYEPNTFSYVGNLLYDHTAVDGSDLQVLASNDFAQGPLNFTLTGSQTLYFQFATDPKELQVVIGGPITYQYPIFTLRKSDGTLVNTFSNSNQYGSTANECRGTAQTLAAGSYTVTTSVVAPNCYGSVKKIRADFNTKKWMYGGGIRIRTISYYTDALASGTPDKQTNYDYSFPDDANKSSGSIASLVSVDGSGLPSSTSNLMSYKYVTVSDTGNNGKTLYEFNSPIDFDTNYSYTYKTGKLKKMTVYNAAGTALESTEYTYTNFESTNSDIIPGLGLLDNLGWSAPSHISQKTYIGSNTVETVNDITYSDNRKPATKQQSTSTSTDVEMTKYFYHTGNSILSKNRIGEIERVERHKNTELLSTQQVAYSNTWIPIGDPATETNYSYLPLVIQQKKESKSLIGKVRINRYDANSHPVEIQQENGMVTCTVWGYNNTQPIAKIDNITGYSSIDASLLSAAVTASNSGNESTLLTALTALRASTSLANSMVTTYTYKPLIGVSTVTDPRGYVMTYEYDELNRLKAVRDADGKLLSESEYYYQPLN